MSDLSTSDLPRRRLGRGLSAMLGSGPAFSESEPAAAELRNIPVNEIARNPFQPRKDFNPDELNELSDSIREHGVLQPILVREFDGAYQLIAGERRWLAAQRAGLTQIPCRVVDVIDQTAFDYALEENLKRKDLTDIEKAMSFRQYLDHFHCSIEELGKQLSMSRSAVSNILRLLELTESVRNALSAGKISSGHARSLLPLPEADQLAVCGQIQAEQLSVRQAEAIVRTLLGREKKAPVVEPIVQAEVPAVVEQAVEQPASVMETQHTQNDNGQDGQSMAPPGDNGDQAPEHGSHNHLEPQILSMEEARSESDRTPHLASLEEQLRNLLGTAVEIKLKSKDSGTILIPFSSNEEFERLLRSLHRAAA
jgi:ParB family transcriptional regulator, chromosome partitioning protein